MRLHDENRELHRADRARRHPEDPHTARRAPADLNGDGAVNAADFFILLALFGPCP